MEVEAEAWKGRVEKARQGERERGELVRTLKEEIGTLQGQAKGAKGRIGELEGALQEVRGALEGARSEIEGLRGEAAVSLFSQFGFSYRIVGAASWEEGSHRAWPRLLDCGLVGDECLLIHHRKPPHSVPPYRKLRLPSLPWLSVPPK